MTTTSPAASPPDPDTVEAPARPATAGRASAHPAWSVGPLLLRLHFYAGVLVAPFIAVAAVTGLLFVFSPQLDSVVYDRELHVPVAGATRPLAEQVAAARAAHPAGELATVNPPVNPGDTTRVAFSLEELGDRQHTVFVDPYTNEVRGTLTTWFGETPLMTWLDDLHRNLRLGVVGRNYSELAASWLWVVALGGLWLWLRRLRESRRSNGVPGKANGRGRGWIRRLLLPDLRAGKGVRRTRGWHAATGVWLVIGLLILSATGMTWSRFAGGHFNMALDALDSSRPVVSTDLGGGAPAASGGGHHGAEAAAGDAPAFDPADVDTVLRVARDAGLGGPVDITPPAEAGTAWTVTQTDLRWPVREDKVAVDPANATVTDRLDFADWPLLAQLTSLGVAAHMGYLFGPVNQALLAALAVGVLCVIVWGYRMWWQRRPTRAARRAPVGAPPVRGAWQRLPTRAVVVGIPLAIGVGWALPLLGVSLLAFLAVDLVLGALAARRARRAIPTSPAPAG
ncbi:PepSY-associated TM helix domain-containing protein [Rhizomonospora bruguierae]|uniref:PepSY-associated TM helix domain-containing protein n=1 Tax=Rhizomonospora bruguierae TaxID=1581705 RepID=UPI001BCC963C|nr:PepSY-associated TM helix domain-containing protein [Micromonospora sp. NBRC 107566]